MHGGLHKNATPTKARRSFERALRSGNNRKAVKILKQISLWCLCTATLGECLSSVPERGSFLALTLLDLILMRAQLEIRRTGKPRTVWRYIKRVVQRKYATQASTNGLEAIAKKMKEMYDTASEGLKRSIVLPACLEIDQIGTADQHEENNVDFALGQEGDLHPSHRVNNINDEDFVGRCNRPQKRLSVDAISPPAGLSCSVPELSACGRMNDGDGSVSKNCEENDIDDVIYKLEVLLSEVGDAARRKDGEEVDLLFNEIDYFISILKQRLEDSRGVSHHSHPEEVQNMTPTNDLIENLKRRTDQFRQALRALDVHKLQEILHTMRVILGCD